MKKLLGLVLALTLPVIADEPQMALAAKEDSVEMRHGDQLLWALHFGEDGQKPYFHPLAAVGREPFTDHRPKDHPWHRGLWFSWKYIDGVNYWEEDKETGLSEGRTRVKTWKKSVRPEGVLIEMSIDYAPVGQELPVLTERRAIVISPLSDKGHYHFDWHAEFKAVDKAVELNRTPPPGEPGGKSWGGYAGLSLRMNETARGGIWLNSEGQQGEAVNRQAAKWLLYQLPDETTVLMMDHPDNPKTGKWYTFAKMPFFSPVPVHDAPITVEPGKPLDLRHRVLVMPQPPTVADAQQAWTQWLSEFPAASNKQ